MQDRNSVSTGGSGQDLGIFVMAPTFDYFLEFFLEAILCKVRFELGFSLHLLLEGRGPNLSSTLQASTPELQQFMFSRTSGLENEGSRQNFATRWVLRSIAMDVGSDDDGHAREPERPGRRPVRVFVNQGSKVYTKAALSIARTQKEQLRAAARAWSAESEILVGTFTTPKEEADGSHVTTAFCMGCEGCRNGECKTLRFEGAWLEGGEMYRLRVAASGDHVGDPIRRAGKREAASRDAD